MNDFFFSYKKSVLIVGFNCYDVTNSSTINIPGPLFSKTKFWLDFHKIYYEIVRNI